MSYGCAGRRDSRRQSAIQRIEASIKRLQDEGIQAKQALDRAKKSGKDLPLSVKEAEDVLASKVRRLKANEECLKNTRANMGKGTAAMYKSN